MIVNNFRYHPSFNKKKIYKKLLIKHPFLLKPSSVDDGRNVTKDKASGEDIP